VCAVPLRLEAITIGCLDLFMTEPADLSAAGDRGAGARRPGQHAMIRHEVVRRTVLDRTMLQRTLDGRIAIEQAKGMIAETADVDTETAFARLRVGARPTDTASRRPRTRWSPDDWPRPPSLPELTRSRRPNGRRATGAAHR
jgi:hypothetical protein